MVWENLQPFEIITPDLEGIINDKKNRIRNYHGGIINIKNENVSNFHILNAE